MWFLRQHFALASLPSAHFHPLPSSHITRHSLCNLCSDRQLAGWGLTFCAHNTKPFNTGAVNQMTLARILQMCLDKRMRISAVQIAIYCATGCVCVCMCVEESGFSSPALWLCWLASGCNPWPLIHECCVVAWECGSGLISLRQRQIEGADFDNVKTEIRFFPFGVSREADKMIGWSGGIYFHPVTSLFKKIHRIINFSFNNILFSNIIMNNCNLLTVFTIILFGWAIHSFKSKIVIECNFQNARVVILIITYIMT